MIGVFDSGVGGLTVLKALLERHPDQEFVYLGDTARLPYGSKSRATIRSYVDQNIRFLQKLGATRIVVACNSASSVLDQDSGTGSIPIHNVIDPGVNAALSATHARRIGIVGTRATISGNAYRDRILSRAPDVLVTQRACPIWVPFVEEGWDEDPLIEPILRRDLAPFQDAQVDTLVLGCTHYPVLAPRIRSILGPSVALIDSAEAISRDLPVERRPEIATEKSAQVRILSTDGGDHFAQISARLLGESIRRTHAVIYETVNPFAEAST